MPWNFLGHLYGSLDMFMALDICNLGTSPVSSSAGSLLAFRECLYHSECVTPVPMPDHDPRTLQGQESRGGEILRGYTHLKPYCLCQTKSLFYSSLLTASPPSTSSSQVQG